MPFIFVKKRRITIKGAILRVGSLSYNIDMLERRNYQKKNLKSIETQNHYSVRKLSVGVVSAIIGFSVLGLSSI